MLYFVLLQKFIKTGVLLLVCLCGIRWVWFNPGEAYASSAEQRLGWPSNSHLLDQKDSQIKCEERKYLVYECHNSCGGLGDRQKGIVSTYLLSILTNRSFVIDMTNPCGIESFMDPNLYDWQVCKKYALSIPKSEALTYGFIDEREKYESVLRKVNFEKDWSKKRRVSFNINWYLIDFVREYLFRYKNNSITPLDWIRESRNEFVVHKLLDVLFRPRKEVSNTVEEFINKKVSNKTLVCSHIRVGKNPTIPNDVSFDIIRGHPNIATLMSFIERYNDNKFVIYVATDSIEVRKKSSAMFKNFVSFNQAIVHIDRLQVSKNKGCVGYHDAIVEQLLLTKCDILLLTMSNFGVLAAIIRGRTDGIFVYDTKSDSIQQVDVWNVFDNYILE